MSPSCFWYSISEVVLLLHNWWLEVAADLAVDVVVGLHVPPQDLLELLADDGVLGEDLADEARAHEELEQLAADPVDRLVADAEVLLLGDRALELEQVGVGQAAALELVLGAVRHLAILAEVLLEDRLHVAFELVTVADFQVPGVHE